MICPASAPQVPHSQRPAAHLAKVPSLWYRLVGLSGTSASCSQLRAAYSANTCAADSQRASPVARATECQQCVSVATDAVRQPHTLQDSINWFARATLAFQQMPVSTQPYPIDLRFEYFMKLKSIG
jgi:hypothetical protein